MIPNLPGLDPRNNLLARVVADMRSGQRTPPYMPSAPPGAPPAGGPEIVEKDRPGILASILTGPEASGYDPNLASALRHQIARPTPGGDWQDMLGHFMSNLAARRRLGGLEKARRREDEAAEASAAAKNEQLAEAFAGAGQALGVPEGVDLAALYQSPGGADLAGRLIDSAQQAPPGNPLLEPFEGGFRTLYDESGDSIAVGNAQEAREAAMLGGYMYDEAPPQPEYGRYVDAEGNVVDATPAEARAGGLTPWDEYMDVRRLNRPQGPAVNVNVNPDGGMSRLNDAQMRAAMQAPRVQPYMDDLMAPAEDGKPIFHHLADVRSNLADEFLSWAPLDSHQAIQTPEFKTAKRAFTGIVRSLLRTESGAQIGPEELMSEMLLHAPHFSDTPEQMAAKEHTLKTYVYGIAQILPPDWQAKFDEWNSSRTPGTATDSMPVPDVPLGALEAALPPREAGAPAAPVEAILANVPEPAAPRRAGPRRAPA